MMREEAMVESLRLLASRLDEDMTEGRVEYTRLKERNCIIIVYPNPDPWVYYDVFGRLIEIDPATGDCWISPELEDYDYVSEYLKDALAAL